MYILRTIFDWVFPPTEEAVRVRNLERKDMETLYQSGTYEGIFTLSSFKNENVRALVHEAKFHNNEKAQMLLNALLLIHLANLKKDFDFVIPVPLSKKRLRERGHNQVLSILTSEELGVPIIKNILLRIKHTHPQTELPKEKRLHNVRGAFYAAHPELIANKRILLIDDVTTTGTTLNAAKASLLPHKPASITCLALAH